MTTDHTLVRPKKLPAGVTLQGWSAAPNEDNLDAVVYGVHHPAGDLKKISKGNPRDLAHIDGMFVVYAPPNTHYEVLWKSGVVEGGSSGSSIMTGKKWPNQFAIGVLTGGSSSCSARKAPDFYGSLAYTYANSKRFRKLLGAE